MPFTECGRCPPTSAWAVGLLDGSTENPLGPGRAAPGASSTDPRSFIARWNGRSWSQSPSLSPGNFDVLQAVGTTSATDSWAVGETATDGREQTLIEHWDGKTWQQVTSPDPDGGDADNNLEGVYASSAGNAWAVGDSGGGAFVLHWDGRSWQDEVSPVQSTDLGGVAGSSAGNAWAVGSITNGSATEPLALHCT
jgi:hypothetical protein